MLEGPLIAVLADGHITSDDAERTHTLVRALDALPASVAALYVLGDLFEVWLGVRAGEPQVERFAEVLRRLRARGVKLGYVEGNRDYRIAEGPYGDLFDVASDRALVERFGQKTYHFTHGDLINTADCQYQAWRYVSKQALAPLALRLLAPETCVRLGHRLERRMRTTNIKHKRRFPTEACLAYSRTAIERGADIVVAGHFHKALSMEVETDARRGLFVSLPFWHDEPRVVYFDRDGHLAGLQDPVTWRRG